MSLTVPHTPVNGDTILPADFNENFDAVEAKFNGAIDATDLKAKWFRFALTHGERNADGGADVGSMPDAQTAVWFETQTPFAFTLEQWALGVQSMGAVGNALVVTIDFNEGADWQPVGTITFTWEGTAGVVVGAPDIGAIPESARLRLSISGTYTSLRSPTFVLWGKQIVAEE